MELGSFRKHERQRHLRSKHATLAVTAEWHNDQAVMPVQVFVNVFVKGGASCQAGRTLRHRRAGRIKNSKRQYIRLAQQVRNGPIHELLRDSHIR